MSNLLEKASIILTPTAYSDGTLHSIKPLQTLGSELVTNGDFATDSDWTLESGWSISNGKLLGTLSNSTNAYQPEALETGKIYQITYEISNYSQGGVRFQFAGGGGTVNGTSNFSNGVFTEKLKATVNHTSIRFRSLTTDGGFTASIDNVSVKEVIDADFDFSRPTTGSATGIGSRENSSGNIESVAADLPRIDYLGGTGHILLEPQSTNTATYSNDFTQGVLFNGSSNPSTSSVLSANQSTSPDGTNTANKLTDNNDGGTGSITLNYNATNFTSGEASTVSMFVKKDTVRYFRIAIANLDTDVVTSFDLDTGLVNDGTGVMTDYGEGWYRCSVTTTTTTDLTGSVSFAISENSDRSGGNLRNGTKSTFLWGLQAEEKSFPTSYIPTGGSTVTRSADVCNNAGSSDLINSTEGVLYGELAALNGILPSELNLSLSNSALNNTAEIGFSNGNNLARFRIRSNNSNIFAQNFSVSDITQFTKMAIKYKSGDIKVFINGSQVYSNTTSFSFSDNLIELAFDRGNGANDFQGKVKCVAVFKEALTDAQLQCLTS
jgi:hypothetical protein